MKSLPPTLQSHLDTGATTLCWCWRLTRRTGERFGFTDHDRDLTFDGTTFEAATGFTATEIRDSIGLSVDNLDVTSALVSDRLSELALSAGDFDDAAVEIFRVNWQSPADRVLMRSGSLGEVRRTGTAFTAEVRGLAHYLQQPKGRLFQYGCDADLGDARCGIDLSLEIYRGEGTIATVSGARVFSAIGLGTFSHDWFTRGLLTFATGGNAGRASEIKRHAVSDSGVSLELWREMGADLAPGDTFIVTAGCDKQFATCQAKFANAASYRGFPHMPGNDFIAASAPMTPTDPADAHTRPPMTHHPIAPTRDAVVAHARAWIGTPYHHQASRIGIGADCLGLIRGVFRALYGHEAESVPGYARDWAEGAGEETMLAAARRHLIEVAPSAAAAGDVLIFRYRHRYVAKHAAILAGPTLIHAIEGAPVSEVPLTGWWRRRIAGAFSFPGVTG